MHGVVVLKGREETGSRANPTGGCPSDVMETSAECLV